MTATVQDLKGVTHVAIRRPKVGNGLMIGALCEDTLDQLLKGAFTIWTMDEIGESPVSCMSCLVRQP